jgi:hypothetical protein
MGNEHSSPDGNQDAPSPPTDRKPVIPKVKGEPKFLGLIHDPELNRDSIVSSITRFHDRVLWTARDSQLLNPDGSVQPLPVISSTASWTDCHPDGSPILQPLPPGADSNRHTALLAYGQNSTKQAFFPVLKGQGHPPAGGRDDGTRFAIWPDAGPLVTHIRPNGHITAYTFIKKAQITSQLQAVLLDPPVSLHRIDYNPVQHGRNHTLPTVTVVDTDFWPKDSIPYGAYGHLLSRDGQTAYLYGMTEQNHITGLARVPLDQIEHKHAYEFYVNGTWTNTPPSLHDKGIHIRNADAGGQGTYYYSPAWDCYVWIGGTKFPGAHFYVSTSPEPEGPWTQPEKFYSGPVGNEGLGAYSTVAHPGLVGDGLREGKVNGVYLSYTKIDDFGKGGVYTTPLVWVEWE